MKNIGAYLLKTMRNSIAIFLLVLLCSSAAYASKVKFYTIENREGVSFREVLSLCKDREGFIWAGAKSGIIRVSEKHAHFYKSPYNTTDYVSVKLAINNANLYSYTNTGYIAKYNNIRDRFDAFLNLRALTKNDQLLVKQIVVDNRNVLWLATSAGLYKYDKRLILVDEKAYGVDFVALYNDTSIFYSSFEGLYLINSTNGKKRTIYANKDLRYQVTAFNYNPQLKKMWLGTNSKGLICYDEDTKHLEQFPPSVIPQQAILAIASYKGNTLLIGIDGQGIWSFDEKRKEVTSVFREDLDDSYSLKGDGVYDILCEDKRTWVGTYTGGISYFETESPAINQISYHPNNPNSLANNHVNKMFEDRSGILWFATNNGLSRWDTKTNRWSNYYKDSKNQSKVFFALSQDQQGNIWAGSFSSGVYVLDSKTGKELNHYYSELHIPNYNNDDILDLFTDSEGDIWIGGNQQLACYFTKEKKFRNYGIQPVNSFAELAKGKVLLTTSRGLVLLDKKTGKVNHLITGTLTQDILVIGNQIWVATSGNGLIKYDLLKKATKQFTTTSGLPSNYVNCIVRKGNYIWIGTELGLCRVNIKTDSIDAYTSNRILSSTSFNVNASTLLQNGNIAMGADNGALIFNPDLIREEIPQGNIYFQNILVSGYSIRENERLRPPTPINQLKKLKLNYNQNNFSLELIPIGTSTDKTKFSWKLEGVDENWSQPSDVEYITYPNLPSGTFELKIRMYNSAISQIISERTLEIQIIPPFWSTLWFRVLLSLFSIGLFYLIFKIYNARIQQRYAKEKLRSFTNTSHEIRTSLTLVKAPIEELNKSPELSDKSRYYLNLATEQTSKLNRVADQLLDLQKMDARKEVLSLSMYDIVDVVKQRIDIAKASAFKRGLKINFTSDAESYFSAIDKIKIEKAVDNLISNAIKYSYENNEIFIRLRCSSNQWILDVQDFGIGIPEKGKAKLFKEFYRSDNAINSAVTGSGIGLLLVKNYAEMHGGKVSYISNNNEGSIFSIVIPYKKELVADNNSEVSTMKYDPTLPTVTNLILTDANDTLPDGKPNLLFVEDNEELQKFLQVVFKDDYHISIAADGIEAWQMIEQQQPDLVISDIMMPNMDGVELCKLIKSTFATAHIPVILLTALIDKSKEREALGLGADDYITKPFDISILQSRIESIITNRKIVREKAMHFTENKDSGNAIVNNKLNDQFIRKALDVVNANMEKTDFGKEAFASEMGVSSSLLYKKTKALTGLSPSEFIKSVRMSYAYNLLQSHEYSVTEISEKVGFSNLSAFSRAFKLHSGKNPTEI